MAIFLGTFGGLVIKKTIALFACLGLGAFAFASEPAASPPTELGADRAATSQIGLLLAETEVDIPGACVQSNNLTGQKMCNEVSGKAFCGKGLPWVTSTDFYEGGKCCGNDAC